MMNHSILQRGHFDQLLAVLKDRGYRIVGPTVRDGAIVYDDLSSTADLPVGWTDEQEGGTYRLKKRADAALFGYVVGPHSWKKFLHPPVVRLWQAERSGQNIQIKPEIHSAPKMAFVGVRSCEIHAIEIQDKVFIGGNFIDPLYKARREGAFLLAVNCG
jgi:sulfhydrogenase subunit beta (sulfur reductase)